ncbi:MAG: serine protease [Myxococcota bacterium]
MGRTSLSVKVTSFLPAPLLVLTAFSCTQQEQADQFEENVQSVIYGSDDRTDVYAYPDSELAAWAVRTSAALVFSDDVIDDSSPNNIRLDARTHTGLIEAAEGLPLCADEPFRNQITAGDCSSTLIAPDLMLTAGHCVSSGNCASVNVVFDYHMVNASQLQTITSDDLYRCSEVVVRRLDENDDYAIFRLDRPVVGRTPAEVNTEPVQQAVGTRLIMNGYPTGLPLKIEDGGRVRAAVDNLTFEATTDSYGGNSGSGVFDASTRRLIGVLTAGETDYVADSVCIRSNECTETGCSGETVGYAHRAISALCAVAPVAALCQGCGDNVCEAARGETSITCAFDCGTDCGDGVCNGDEAPTNCEADCGRCGNLVCDADESTETCCIDCGCTESNNMCIDNACSLVGGDSCAEAVTLSAVSLQTLEGTTRASTHTFAPDDSCAPNLNARDTVFRIVVPSNSTVRASVLANFDTILYAQRACGVSQPQAACNDDVEPNNLNSAITVSNASGELYLIVDGFSGDDFGQFELTVRVSSGLNPPGPGPGAGLDDDSGGCRCTTSNAPPASSFALVLFAVGAGIIRGRRRRS